MSPNTEPAPLVTTPEPVVSKGSDGSVVVDRTAAYERRKAAAGAEKDGASDNTVVPEHITNQQRAADADKPAVADRARALARQLRSMALPLRNQPSPQNTPPPESSASPEPATPPSRGLGRIIAPVTQLIKRPRAPQSPPVTSPETLPAPPVPESQVPPQVVIGRDNETGREVLGSPVPEPLAAPVSEPVNVSSPIIPPTFSPEVPHQQPPVIAVDTTTETAYQRKMGQQAQREAAEAAAATRKMEDDAARTGWTPGYVSSSLNVPGAPPSLPRDAVIYEPMHVPDPGEEIHGAQVYNGSRMNPDTPRKRRNVGELARDILADRNEDKAVEGLVRDMQAEFAAIRKLVNEFRDQAGEIDQEKVQDYLRLYSDEVADNKYTHEDEVALRFLTFISKSLASPDNHYDYRSGAGRPCRSPITSVVRGEIIMAYCDSFANQLSPGSGVERRVWEEAKRLHPDKSYEEAYAEFGDEIRSTLMRGQGLGLSAERSQKVIVLARQLLSQEFDQLTLPRINLDNDAEVAAAYGITGETPQEIQAALDKRRKNVQNADLNLGDVAKAMGLQKISALTMNAEHVAQLSGYNAEDIAKWQRIVKKDQAIYKKIDDRSKGLVVFLQFDEETQKNIDELVASLEARRDAKGKRFGQQLYDKEDKKARLTRIEQKTKTASPENALINANKLNDPDYRKKLIAGMIEPYLAKRDTINTRQGEKNIMALNKKDQDAMELSNDLVGEKNARAYASKKKSEASFSHWWAEFTTGLDNTFVAQIVRVIVEALSRVTGM